MVINIRGIAKEYSIGGDNYLPQPLTSKPIRRQFTPIIANINIQIRRSVRYKTSFVITQYVKKSLNSTDRDPTYAVMSAASML